MSSNYLIAFKAISNFIKSLHEVYGDSIHSLELYSHLIKKTTFDDDEPIRKHVDAFKVFCELNRDAISNKDHKLISGNIEYSKKVYLDMRRIFVAASVDTARVIWQHLLTISAIVDPTGNARKILKDDKEASGKEVDFLTGIMDTVADKIDPNASPAEAISAVMQSGIFTDLISNMGQGLQTGDLDLSKLMGTVQKMVVKMSEDSGDPAQGEQAMGMINNMVSSMGLDKNDGAPPDIGGMMGMISGLMGNGMMSGMTNNMGGGAPRNDIAARIDRQVAEAKSAGTL